MALIQTPSFVCSTPPRPHSPHVPRGFVGRVVAGKLCLFLKLLLFEWFEHILVYHFVIAKNMSLRPRKAVSVHLEFGKCCGADKIRGLKQFVIFLFGNFDIWVIK